MTDIKEIPQQLLNILVEAHGIPELEAKCIIEQSLLPFVHQAIKEEREQTAKELKDLVTESTDEDFGTIDIKRLGEGLLDYLLPPKRDKLINFASQLNHNRLGIPNN